MKYEITDNNIAVIIIYIKGEIASFLNAILNVFNTFLNLSS